MPVIIAPVDAYPANFTTFADGDAVNQANFANNMQEFADAIAYLRNRTLPAVPFTLSQPLGGPAGQTGAAFAYNSTTKLWRETLAAGDTITWGADLGATLPAGGPFRIVSVTCWTRCVTHPAGAPPVPAQAISLDYHDPAGGSAIAQNVTSFSDPSNGADLATLHSFGSGVIAHTIVAGGSYSVTYTSEIGAGPDTDIHAILFAVEPV